MTQFGINREVAEAKLFLFVDAPKKGKKKADKNLNLNLL